MELNKWIRNCSEIKCTKECPIYNLCHLVIESYHEINKDTQSSLKETFKKYRIMAKEMQSEINKILWEN